jgi:GNAT superfamily N-acetyltransferase
LYRIERFYDAVPRTAADAEPHGPLTLFVRRGPGWPYYARPTLGAAAPDVNGILTVRARQRELGVPEEFEWIDEITPRLAPAAFDAGLAVRRCPLMVLDPGRMVVPSVPPGFGLRFLDPSGSDAAELFAAIDAVGSVAFSGRGGGPAERDAALTSTPLDETRTARLESGALVRAVLSDNSGEGLGVLCSGGYQRAGDVAEIVGVATLPSHQRRGLGAALTAALASHALDAGCELVFLSAGDDDVARGYGRLGFSRVGTACLAAP